MDRCSWLRVAYGPEDRVGQAAAPKSQTACLHGGVAKCRKGTRGNRRRLTKTHNSSCKDAVYSEVQKNKLHAFFRLYLAVQQVTSITQKRFFLRFDRCVILCLRVEMLFGKLGAAVQDSHGACRRHQQVSFSSRGRDSIWWVWSQAGTARLWSSRSTRCRSQSSGLTRTRCQWDLGFDVLLFRNAHKLPGP